MRLSLIPFAALTLAACSGGPQPSLEAPPSPTTPPTAAPVDLPEPTDFENQGGMWMPQQLAGHADTLKGIGFTVDPAAYTDPTKHPLGAVVWLGGCSASFVSDQGLIITNHHCVTRALQVNSKPEENLLRDGFHAKSMSEERSAGPTQRVYVTRSIRDVTNDVRSGLEDVKDDIARFETIEERQKELVAKCENDRAEIRCTVAKFFEGAQYFLIEQLEIRDIRLVYAPPEMIGSYGGEIDNWRWPRHSGDFAFYRAYVGKDGKPADFAEDNVPYDPPHILKLASEPLRPGHPVMVAGYPGRTGRHKTAGEVAEAVEWSYPRRVQFCEEYIAMLEKIGEGDEEVKIKAEPLYRGLSNWLTNTKGMLDGLVKDGLAKSKAETEKELRAFIDADPDRKAKYGDVFEKMDALQEQQKKTREADIALWETTRLTSLLKAADTINRMAEERPKPDAERDPDYQKRNHKPLEQGLASLENTYHRELDIALLTLAAKRELALPKDQRAGIAAAILQGKPANDENLEKSIRAIYEKTTLEDAETRSKLLNEASVAQLKANPDPMIQLAWRLRPMLKAQKEREEKFEGAMSVQRPRYIAALRAFTEGDIAPDANSTLRVTYGSVRGYAPKPGAAVYHPFTKLVQIKEKHTGEEPFDAPDAELKAIEAGQKGPYVDETLGDVPVNFLADLDITGGNSGSATLNRHGELVGLVFDGNYEAMASDWLFMPEVTRSIHVDLRYILWVLDGVSGADNVLTELGVKPAL